VAALAILAQDRLNLLGETDLAHRCGLLVVGTGIRRRSECEANRQHQGNEQRAKRHGKDTSVGNSNRRADRESWREPWSRHYTVLGPISANTRTK
jgi:hypothetical protein